MCADIANLGKVPQSRAKNGFVHSVGSRYSLPDSPITQIRIPLGQLPERHRRQYVPDSESLEVVTVQKASLSTAASKFLEITLVIVLAEQRFLLVREFAMPKTMN